MLQCLAMRRLQFKQGNFKSPRYSRLGLVRAFAWFACLAATPLIGAPMRDPEVDRYNVHVGTQAFKPLYHFTSNAVLEEEAQAILGLGSDIIKFHLAPNSITRNGPSNSPGVTNLATLARDESCCRHVLDMPFRHYFLWAESFTGGEFRNGFIPLQQTNEYREIYDLARYFLTQYDRSGKAFYLGHWEGDWLLLPNYNTGTNPSPAAIQGMIDWLTVRQRAVDDARRDTPHTNVFVYVYAEANRVRDAMNNPAGSNQRVINRVVPRVTNLDYVSWSSYEVQDLSVADLYSTLDYMQAQLPAGKAGAIPGRRVFVGEYGWGGTLAPAQQEAPTRAYIQRLMKWGCPFALFWELYDNETNRNYCLIDSNNVKTACYFLHQRFINQARLLVAQFKQIHSRLPSDAEFSSMVFPTLDQPFTAPLGLAVSNKIPAGLGVRSAVVQGSVTQGIYGDDWAQVKVFWGTKDGATVRADWQNVTDLGVNNSFCAADFKAVLADLAPAKRYFYRFYATNNSGEAFAPVTATFQTP